MENKKKEIDRDVIVELLEELFEKGYTDLKVYLTGKVFYAFYAFNPSSNVAGKGDVAFHISLQELLEGFVEDTSMSWKDVESLDTKNPNGVIFGDYLLDVADELWENIEVE